MVMTTQSFSRADRARLLECEAALQRLREQVREIRKALGGENIAYTVEAATSRAMVYVQGAEEILGNTLGDEPSP